MVRGRIVHVGLHRTATTWLQSRFFAAVGGVHNDFRQPWDDPLISALVTGGPVPDVPENCIISAERLGGHPRSGWYDADGIADRIAARIPDARIVVGHRDPATWVDSLYAVLVELGETRTLDDLLTPRWEGPHMDLSLVSPEALEERYRSRFEEVLLLPQERLLTDFDGYVEDLSVFLGAEVPDVDPSPVNVSPKTNLRWRRMLNHFVPSMYNRSPLFAQLPLPGGLRDVLRRLRGRTG